MMSDISQKSEALQDLLTQKYSFYPPKNTGAPKNADAGGDAGDDAGDSGPRVTVQGKDYDEEELMTHPIVEFLLENLEQEGDDRYFLVLFDRKGFV